jgi:hypothetical protein
MPINRADFARDCVDQALFFGVNPHYLVAVAELLSGIKDDTEGDRIGPFRRTAAEWKDKGRDDEFQVALQEGDVKDPGMQCIFAALQTVRAQEALRTKLGRYPSPDELYAEWPKDQPPAGKTLQGALDSTKDLILPAVDAALKDLDEGVLVGDIKLDTVPATRKEIARQIITAFAGAGFGKLQQVAGLANAIAESNLNPEAHNTKGEDSVGLFQLNRNGGLGTGHSVESLKNPAKNIEIIINEAKKFPAFAAATALQDAVAVFVRKVERPADPGGEIVKRVAIAQKLVA